MTELTCFKSYDVRGKLGTELNDEIAYRIGRGFAVAMTPKTVVIGYDIRPTSPELAAALTKGLRDEGVDVIDIGLCGTEEVYFATSHYGLDGGLMVTASHNPIESRKAAWNSAIHAKPTRKRSSHFSPEMC